MSENKLRFETKQIHGGYHVDATGSRGVAIYPTAAYHFKSCDYAARLFELSEGGNIYTRLQNPTSSAYEERVAALYNGVGALALSSGMSAILITVTALASAGDNIVASPYLYGGTYNQFRISLRKLGVDCRIAKSERVEDFEALIDDKTKMIFAESMGNPTCDVPDLEALAEVAKRKGTMYDMELYAKQGHQASLGKAYYDLSGEKVVFLQSAYSGAPIESWLDPARHKEEAGTYGGYYFYPETQRAYKMLMKKLEGNYGFLSGLEGKQFLWIAVADVAHGIQHRSGHRHPDTGST
mgnify:CR=1 FL=1